MNILTSPFPILHITLVSLSLVADTVSLVPNTHWYDSPEITYLITIIS